MSATPYLLQPPLAVGFARLGFGSLSLESLRERYAAPSSGSRFHSGITRVDPAGYQMRKVPWMIASAALPGSTLVMPLWMPRALIAQGIKEVYGEPGRIKPGVVDRYYDLSRRPGNRKGMMEIFRVLLKVNREELGTSGERIARIVAPTLLMWGERDRWISPKHVPLWQRDLPGIQVKTYPGVGHIPMEEIPEQTAADALRFLMA